MKAKAAPDEARPRAFHVCTKCGGSGNTAERVNHKPDCDGVSISVPFCGRRQGVWKEFLACCTPRQRKLGLPPSKLPDCCVRKAFGPRPRAVPLARKPGANDILRINLFDSEDKPREPGSTFEHLDAKGLHLITITMPADLSSTAEQPELHLGVMRVRGVPPRLLHGKKEIRARKASDKKRRAKLARRQEANA